MLPVEPVAPVGPATPVTPAGPIVPAEPATPGRPVGPVAPVGPTTPVTPVGPAVPAEPGVPEPPVAPVAPVTPMPAGPWAPVVPTAPALPVKPRRSRRARLAARQVGAVGRAQLEERAWKLPVNAAGPQGERGWGEQAAPALAAIVSAARALAANTTKREAGGIDMRLSCLPGSSPGLPVCEALSRIGAGARRSAVSYEADREHRASVGSYIGRASSLPEDCARRPDTVVVTPRSDRPGHAGIRCAAAVSQPPRLGVSAQRRRRRRRATGVRIG